MPRNSRARRPLRPLLVTAVAVTGATLALAAAVLSGPGTPTAGERPPPVRLGGAGATTADDRLLHDAEQLLLRDCMRQEGFTYHVFPLAEDSGDQAFPYVLDNASWARQHGYGAALLRRRAALAASDPNRAYFAALPPDRQAEALVAANGPSPDGPTVRLPGGGTLRRGDRGCVADGRYGQHRRRRRHTMRIMRALATALTVGSLSLLTAPVADAAAPPSATAPAAVPAPDGFLYAWEHPHAAGFHCKWKGDNSNWAGCAKKVSDVWNNGFPGRGEDVMLFHDQGFTGSWVCLHQSHSIPDLGLSGLRFFGPGHGKGEFVNDNVQLHKWVDAC